MPECLAMDVEGLGRVRVLELDVEGPEVTYVRSEHAVKPDPAWRHVDRQGHAHEWAPENGERDRASRLPTLEPFAVHQQCDGSCRGACEGGGWWETAFRCRACGEVVEPRYVPDWTARNVGTPIVTGPAAVRVFTERVAGVQIGDLARAARISGERASMAAQVWPVAYEYDVTGQTRVEWGGVLRDG